MPLPRQNSILPVAGVQRGTNKALAGRMRAALVQLAGLVLRDPRGEVIQNTAGPWLYNLDSRGFR